MTRSVPAAPPETPTPTTPYDHTEADLPPTVGGEGILVVAPPPGRSAIASRASSVAVGTAWAFLGLAVFAALWWFAASLTVDENGIRQLTTPTEAADSLIKLLLPAEHSYNPFYDSGNGDQGVLLYLYTSLQRVFLGFGIAALVGIPLGLLMGALRPAWFAMNPIVQLLRPVSPLAWFPICLVVLKDAGLASVLVIFITALWPILINTAAGAAAIPRDHANVAKVFRFGPMAYVRHVLIPNALPGVITGLRLSVGIAWMVIVAVEMLSGKSGIGFFVWDSYNAGKYGHVIASIVLIGIVGLVLDAILLKVSRWVAIEEVHA